MSLWWMRVEYGRRGLGREGSVWTVEVEGEADDSVGACDLTPRSRHTVMGCG